MVRRLSLEDESVQISRVRHRCYESRSFEIESRGLGIKPCSLLAETCRLLHQPGSLHLGFLHCPRLSLHGLCRWHATVVHVGWNSLWRVLSRLLELGPLWSIGNWNLGSTGDGGVNRHCILSCLSHAIQRELMKLLLIGRSYLSGYGHFARGCSCPICLWAVAPVVTGLKTRSAMLFLLPW